MDLTCCILLLALIEQDVTVCIAGQGVPGLAALELTTLGHDIGEIHTLSPARFGSRCSMLKVPDSHVNMKMGLSF